ncbi:MAG TPA: PriCT-2 domain-containing protein [Geminicoccus sp.]|jgi:hypothetical protein|uniref:PriCT-2 domain-containing protein n=1 Tax=Geminicoccus sp. TaxID=2024832 RepID=UPI002E360993|nr:PriCT-2 domain-containing protein [Geminicoccus sp.]HEX2526174.1 PriCT-2 domain-containing protein [Geminicoccus sp.]
MSSEEVARRPWQDERAGENGAESSISLIDNQTNFMAEGDRGAKLVDQGHHILPVIPRSKTPGDYYFRSWHPMPDWGRYGARLPTDLELDHWRRWPGCGIGLCLNDKFVIDCDVANDADISETIRNYCEKQLGSTVTKVGQPTKWSAIYRTPKPIRPIKLHPLEGLGAGNQTVIYNTHSGTGLPYFYPFGDEILEVHHDDLPVLTEHQVHKFLREAFEMIPERLRQRRLSACRSRTAMTSGHDLRGTPEAIVDSLDWIPNADLCWDDWIAIGMAIKGALGEDGWDLFDTWSRRSSKYAANTTKRTWSGFRPHSRGAGTLYYLARQNGWQPAPQLILNAATKEAAESVHIDFDTIRRNALLKKEARHGLR